MIETKDLVNYIKESNASSGSPYLHLEYCEEIVARLRAYDKLKESIEKLCRRLSDEVDK